MATSHRHRVNMAHAKAAELQAEAEEASAVALVAKAQAEDLDRRPDLGAQYRRLAEHSLAQARIYRGAAAQFRRLAG